MRRGTWLALVTAIGIGSVVSAAPAADDLSKAERRATASRNCGTDRLYARTFGVRTEGEDLTCAEAAEIIDARCRIKLEREWSCFSFRESAPFIIWFPSEELFARRWSEVVYYRRYPCSEARVTRRLFTAPLRGFPTRRQMLADDLIRCDLLEGFGYRRTGRLLGPADDKGKYRGRRYRDYVLGPERDSFFQVDDEYLSVTFSKAGRVRNVSMYQG